MISGEIEFNLFAYIRLMLLVPLLDKLVRTRVAQVGSNTYVN